MKRIAVCFLNCFTNIVIIFKITKNILIKIGADEGTRTPTHEALAPKASVATITPHPRI